MSNPGYRIRAKIERAPQELVDQFKGLPVANIADTMNRLCCLDQGIKPYNKVKLLGVAFTVKAPSGDNLMFHKAIEMAEKGDIIMVDGEGCMTRSICGGLMIAEAAHKGIKGFVVDGCIRDVEDLEAMEEFSCYARGVQPNGPYKNGPGEIGYAINVGGQIVHAGDIVVGDADGIAIIKKQDAEDVLKKTLAFNEMEKKKMNNIMIGKADKRWVDETLAKNNCEMI